MMRIIKVNSKLVPNKAKVVALSLLIACSALGGTAFAASSAPSKTGLQGTDVAATAQPQSTSTGFELDYYHAEKASRTYALRLKNGLSASFDFDSGTVTLTDVAGRQKTFPLDQALLQATNGNSQEAVEMYDQLSQSIDAAKSDAVMAYASSGSSSASQGISPNFFPPPRGTIGLGDNDGSLWATPMGGNCFPIPGLCHEWEGGLSSWGRYNNWWGSNFGAPPPTTQPPSPDNCAPDDMACTLWEHDRQDACDDSLGDNLAIAGSSILAGGACAAAAETAGLASWACVGTVINVLHGVHSLNKHSRQCHTPYPGH